MFSKKLIWLIFDESLLVKNINFLQKSEGGLKKISLNKIPKEFALKYLALTPLQSEQYNIWYKEVTHCIKKMQLWNTCKMHGVCKISATIIQQQQQLTCMITSVFYLWHGRLKLQTKVLNIMI